MKATKGWPLPCYAPIPVAPRTATKRSRLVAGGTNCRRAFAPALSRFIRGVDASRPIPAYAPERLLLMTRTVTALATLLVFSIPVAVKADKGADDTNSAAAAPAVQSFGEKLAAGETIPVAQVLADPSKWEGKVVRVEGLVRRACTKKGCWMEIVADGNESPTCRVTFKDYGFFVPLDAAGSKATLAGTVEVAQVPRARVDHLAAEGATFATVNEDGSASEVRIVATGVELRR